MTRHRKGPTLAEFIQVLVGGLTLASAYFLLAAGVTLVFGQTRIVNFAHGQFLVIAGLIVWWMDSKGVPFIIGVIAAVAIVSCLAAVLEVALLRRVSANPLSAFLVTLGVLIILTQLTVELFGSYPRQLTPPITGSWTIGGVTLGKASLAVLGLSIITGACLFVALRRLRIGREIRASAEDPVASAHLGINVTRVASVTFIIGSALAAWAGVLLAMLYPLSAQQGGDYLIKGFTVAIVGGLGSVEGALVGALGLGIFEQLGQAYWQPQWVPAIGIVLLIGVLLVRPSGLFGRKQRLSETSSVGALLPHVVAMPKLAKPLLWFGAVVLFFLPSLGITAEAQSLASFAVVYAVVAASVAFLFRSAGYLSFGSGAFFGIGAYVSALGATKWGIGFWPSLGLSAIVSGLIATAVAIPAFRTRGFYFLMVTFVVADLFSLIELNWTGLTGGSNGITVLNAPPSILGLSFGSPGALYRLLFVLAAVALGVIWLVERSRLGGHLNAIRDNEPLARSLGLNATIPKVIGFGFAGAIAGYAGALFIYQSSAISPDLFGGFATVTFPLMVILGGARVGWGPPIGALVLTFIPYWFNLGPSGTQFAYGIVLILIMVFVPEGIGPGVLRLWASVGRHRRSGTGRATPADAPVSRGDLVKIPPTD